MTARVLRIAAFAALMGVVALGTWFAGRWVAGRRVPAGQAVVPALLQVGEGLPRAVVHTMDRNSVWLQSLIDEDGPTYIVFFQFGCASCEAEAVVWDSLARNLHQQYAVRLIVCGASLAQVQTFRTRTAFRSGMWLCDTSTKIALHAEVTPTIYEVDGVGRVLSAERGPSATGAMLSRVRAAHHAAQTPFISR